jgi:hypothetical protein
MSGRIKWEEIPWEEVNETKSRKIFVGERIMMVMYRNCYKSQPESSFKPRMSWPEEIHDNEQAGYVIKGKVELNLPSKGQKILLEAGDGYLIEPNTPHFWRALEGETISIDIFSPPRTELLKNKFAPKATKEALKAFLETKP